MAHKTFEQYEKEVLKTIKKEKLYTIEMIFAFYSGISRSQFYNIGLNKSDSIIKELDDNKNRTKQSLLNKWFESPNATLQIALMRLLATPEERRMLNQSYIDHTTKGKEVNQDLSKLSTEEIKNLLDKK